MNEKLDKISDTQKGDEIVPQRIIDEKPILHYAAHNLLGYSDPIFRSLENKLVFIEVVRHPLYMVIQNMINHINILKINEIFRSFNKRIY